MRRQMESPSPCVGEEGCGGQASVTQLPLPRRNATGDASRLEVQGWWRAGWCRVVALVANHARNVILSATFPDKMLMYLEIVSLCRAYLGVFTRARFTHAGITITSRGNSSSNSWKGTPHFSGRRSSGAPLPKEFSHTTNVQNRGLGNTMARSSTKFREHATRCTPMLATATGTGRLPLETHLIRDGTVPELLYTRRTTECTHSKPDSTLY